MARFSYFQLGSFFLSLLIRIECCSLTNECVPVGYFTTVHVLVVDVDHFSVAPVRACTKKQQSRETVLSMLNRTKAVAAVNGGFWKENGEPAGILKIAGIWMGTPTKPRGAIGWSNRGGQVLIDQVLMSKETPKKVIPQSDPPYTISKEWEAVDHIVGGTPVLIRGGNIIEDFSSERTLTSFLTRRYPRTAVGILDNCDWVFVVVDGSYYGLLGGMTMNELALFMNDLGCVEALNLDGGGSSTMVLDGEVINKPCGDISENGRTVSAVSDAILIFPKE